MVKEGNRPKVMRRILTTLKLVTSKMSRKRLLPMDWHVGGGSLSKILQENFMRYNKPIPQEAQLMGGRKVDEENYLQRMKVLTRSRKSQFQLEFRILWKKWFWKVAQSVLPNAVLTV